MVGHDVVWALGTTIRFGSLDFVLKNEGEMVRALEARPPPLESLSTVTDALKYLCLVSQEQDAGQGSTLPSVGDEIRR